MTGGGTTPARAPSKAAAAAPAAAAASWHCPAVAIIHTTYGAAANAIEIDDGPSQASEASAAMTELNAAPEEPNSAAKACQEAAEAARDDEPGPAYIRPELISGGTS